MNMSAQVFSTIHLEDGGKDDIERDYQLPL